MKKLHNPICNILNLKEKIEQAIGNLTSFRRGCDVKNDKKEG